MKLLMLATMLATVSANADYLIKERILADGEKKILSVSPYKKSVDKKKVLKELPEFLGEHDQNFSINRDIYRETVVPESELKKEHLFFLQSFDLMEKENLPNFEMRALVEQGDPSNRINLPILAEGYTLAEKEKFFEDCQRIVGDLFGHKAFASYLPLFNVYAIFVSSRESGVTDIERKDTAFGLYRSPAGSKRGIVPSSTWAIDRAFNKAPGADYPIILVNDDYYGGLGGRYAITTRSLTSGSMVLRHELGHNFGNVGEEYDGGYVYSGANHSSSSSRLKWDHWIEGQKEVYETKFLQGSYLWKDMTNQDIHVNFNFPKGDYMLDLKVSSVGWSHEHEVESHLDGHALKLNGLYTKDRSFFFPDSFIKLKEGRHKLSFYDRSKDGDNVFAFAMIYAQPTNLNTTHGHVGAYAVYDVNRNKQGYRPTYETCLMRNMRSDELCSVDKENMWVRFLNKVELVDSIEQVENKSQKQIVVRTPKLNGLSFILLDRNNNVLARSNNGVFVVNRNTEAYKVRVEFRTPEVRKYNQNFVVEKRI
jgi:hypothetical protein